MRMAAGEAAENMETNEQIVEMDLNVIQNNQGMRGEMSAAAAAASGRSRMVKALC